MRLAMPSGNQEPRRNP
ncbi:TPA: YmiA family putative membrane protein, partial [Escherichia coli]